MSTLVGETWICKGDMLDGDRQGLIVTMIDAQGIFFRENNVIPNISRGALRKTKGYDVRSKHLFCVSSSSGLGEAPLRDTFGNGAWCMV